MSAPCLPVIHRKKRKRIDNHQHQDLPGREGESTIRKTDPDDNDHDDEEVTFDDIATIDANEYLSRVVIQAKKIPNIIASKAVGMVDQENANATTCTTSVPTRYRNHVPIDGSAADVAYLLSGRASLTRPPTEDYLPLQKDHWIKITLSNFERLRDYLEDCREKGVGGKLTDRIVFPPMKDRSGWHAFCVGHDEACGNIKSYFGEEYDNLQSGMVTMNGNVDEASDWKCNLPPNGHVPTVRVVSQMDQVLVRKVLSHLCHYTEKGWKMSQQRSAWLYASLARLEKPVHRDDASNLFGLLKTLTLRRSKLDLQSEDDRTELSQLNILITIVGIFFEQGATVTMSVPSTSTPGPNTEFTDQ